MISPLRRQAEGSAQGGRAGTGHDGAGPWGTGTRTLPSGLWLQRTRAAKRGQEGSGRQGDVGRKAARAKRLLLPGAEREEA